MVTQNNSSVSKVRTSATTTALIRRHDIALAITGGVLLAIGFIVLGLPFLLTGALPALAVQIALLICGFAAFAWFVWRIRGSEIRKHGGRQAAPPVLVMAVITALLLLTACSGDPVGGKRTNAQTSNTTTPQNSGNASAQGAEWERVLSAPVPTAVHYPAKCPGATNAEIDAALQSNEPWVCYAATREAAK